MSTSSIHLLIQPQNSCVDYLIPPPPPLTRVFRYQPRIFSLYQVAPTDSKTESESDEDSVEESQDSDHHENDHGSDNENYDQDYLAEDAPFEAVLNYLLASPDDPLWDHPEVKTELLRVARQAGVGGHGTEGKWNEDRRVVEMDDRPWRHWEESEGPVSYAIVRVAELAAYCGITVARLIFSGFSMLYEDAAPSLLWCRLSVEETYVNIWEPWARKMSWRVAVLTAGSLKSNAVRVTPVETYTGPMGMLLDFVMQDD